MAIQNDSDTSARVLARRYRIPQILFSCIVIVLLASCMGGIQPQAKLDDAQALNAGSAIQSADKIDWPNEDWWTAYGDAQLNALVEKAIAGNPTLQIAQSRVVIAQSYAQVARGATTPDIKLDESNIRERLTSVEILPPPYGGQTYWDNKLDVALSYDLDLWGKQKSLWRAAVSEAQAAQAEAQQTKLMLEADVVRYYVQLALACDLKVIATDEYQQRVEKADIAKRKLKAGLGTALELNQEETRLPPAYAELVAIDARIEQLRHQLAALAGLGPGDAESIHRPKLALNAPIGLPQDLPANLVGRRPDIVASRWYVEASNEKIKSAKAEFYPNINLSAAAGFISFGFDKFISSDARNISAGPAFSLPIFDGGTRRGHLAVQTSTYDIAVDNYNNTLVQALQDISDQLVALQASAKQRAQIEQALRLSQQTYVLQQESYRAGLSAYENVVDAKLAWLEQQQSAARIAATQRDSYAALMRALGGGFHDDETPARHETPALDKTPASAGQH